MASIRRINGKGGVSYKITVSQGLDPLGNQIRHYKTWKPPEGMTARQAEKEANRVAFEFERALSIGFQADNRQTFSQYAEYYIDLKQRQGAAANTIEIYKQFVARITPKIGKMRISDIRPQHLNKLYDDLMRPGERHDMNKARPIIDIAQKIKDLGETQQQFAVGCGLNAATITHLLKGGAISDRTAEKIAAHIGAPVKKLFLIIPNAATLSPNTIKRLHTFLTGVFYQAQKEMLIDINPAQRATPPRMVTKEPRYFQPEQIIEILRAAETEPIKWRTMLTLFVLSGARRGEILALKWANVDFKGQQITFDANLSYLTTCGIYEGPTKTKTARTIPLPAEMFSILRKYRAWQSERRLSLGDLWNESDYVFTTDLGKPIQPNVVNRHFLNFAKKNGLPPINPHSFRHSAASIMIANGIDIIAVAKMLGHTKATTTIDIYGHAIEAAKREAAECIAETILGKKSG